MIPEFGHFALVLALGIALVQSFSPWLSLIRVKTGGVVATAARLQFFLVTVSFLVLANSFVRDDFSVLYVANHSNATLPIPYKLAAVWGGHEGSMLLWVEILASWSFAVTVFGRGLPSVMRERALGILGVVSSGFLTFILLTSNPFLRVFPVPGNGQDLNPLLQDPGMVLHPPLLYMGYVGFSVPFAISVAALINGRMDAAWARWMRPWTTAAWSFLTMGIALGSYWAYYELGWGGWWFWDPVENASFMPWLVGTALIHSLAVSERLGSLKAWTVLLAITAFGLSLLGTFLVRSGVLTSVHAFATDPKRGIFILVLLVFLAGSSLMLFSFRAQRLSAPVTISFMSREFALLANSLLLLVAAASILLGTLYPLVLEILDLGKVSVGAPYFESVFVPLIIPVVFLCGIGPLLSWRYARVRGAFAARLASLFALAAMMVSAFFSGRWGPLYLLGVLAGAWSVVAACASLVISMRAAARSQPRRVLWGRVSRAQCGMMLAHAGLGIFILGVTFVKVFEVERDVRLAVGESTSVADFSFRLERELRISGANFEGQRVLIGVYCEGQPCAVMAPEKRIYNVQRSAMSETAIDSDFRRDLYVSLGDRLSDGSWTMRIHVKPLISWIWWGCLIMALGGLLSVSDRRYRFDNSTSRTNVETTSSLGAV